MLLPAFTVATAQRLDFEQLEHMLYASLDGAEENLFLLGYSFLHKKENPDSLGVIYTFSNRKQTIGTAKMVAKVVYPNELDKSLLKYITYDRSEFESFRKLMVENQFIRSDKDDISENSNYSKGSLKVNFEVTTDEYENKVFYISLSTQKPLQIEKLPKKLSLKNIFKQG